MCKIRSSCSPYLKWHFHCEINKMIITSALSKSKRRKMQMIDILKFIDQRHSLPHPVEDLNHQNERTWRCWKLNEWMTNSFGDVAIGSSIQYSCFCFVETEKNTYVKKFSVEHVNDYGVSWIQSPFFGQWTCTNSFVCQGKPIETWRIEFLLLSVCRRKERVSLLNWSSIILTKIQILKRILIRR